MEKYGFIYVWFDKQYNRFYVGRHWGTENDGYICSSNSMRDAHRRRPNDFKRRIVSRVHTKETLIIEEQRWLDMIKPEELNKKYYNKTQKATTPSTLGYNHSEETKQKIKLSNIGKSRSETTKNNNKKASIKQFSDPEQKKKISDIVKKQWQDPEYRQRQIAAHKGKPSARKGATVSEETKQKLREKRKLQAPMSDEARQKLREKQLGTICINNGIINSYVPATTSVPAGFVKGKLKRYK